MSATHDHIVFDDTQNTKYNLFFQFGLVSRHKMSACRTANYNFVEFVSNGKEVFFSQYFSSLVVFVSIFSLLLLFFFASK